MISKLLTTILNRLGYIHWSQLDQPETGSLEKRKAEQAEIKAFIINGFDSEKLECCPWVKGWLDAQEEYFWHLSHLKRTGRANPLFKHNNQPSSEGVWLGAVQIQYTLLRAVTYCFSSFALKDESRPLSEDEAVKLGELALNIHKTTRHTSTVRLPSGLDDMDWIQSIHSEIKGELLGEIKSLLSNSPMGMDAEKLWCRVLVNEVYYQVYGLLNIPPYKPHDFLISSISDFKNPRKVKYAASAPTYSFPLDLFPVSKLEENMRFVERNRRLVNSDTLFEMIDCERQCIDDYYGVHIKKNDPYQYECGPGGVGGIMFPVSADWTRELVAQLVQAPPGIPPLHCVVPIIDGYPSVYLWVEERTVYKSGGLVLESDLTFDSVSMAFSVHPRFFNEHALPSWVKFRRYDMFSDD